MRKPKTILTMEFKCIVNPATGNLELKDGGLTSKEGHASFSRNFLCSEITKLLKVKDHATIQISTHDFPGAFLAKTTWTAWYELIHCRSVKLYHPGTTARAKPVFEIPETMAALYVNMEYAIEKTLGTRTIKDKDTIVGYIGITPKENTK